VPVTDRPGISSFKETHTHGHSSCYVVKGQKEEEEALMEPAVNSWARPARNITACVLIARPTSNPHMRHVSPPPHPPPLLSLGKPKNLLPSLFILFYNEEEEEDPDRVVDSLTSCNNLLFLSFPLFFF
jgi:hypothetical protein